MGVLRPSCFTERLGFCFSWSGSSSSSSSEEELAALGAVGGVPRSQVSALVGLDLDQLRLDQAAAASQQLPREGSPDGSSSSTSEAEESSTSSDDEDEDDVRGSWATVASRFDSDSSESEMQSSLPPPSCR